MQEALDILAVIVAALQTSGDSRPEAILKSSHKHKSFERDQKVQLPTTSTHTKLSVWCLKPGT